MHIFSTPSSQGALQQLLLVLILAVVLLVRWLGASAIREGGKGFLVLALLFLLLLLLLQAWLLLTQLPGVRERLWSNAEVPAVLNHLESR